MKLFFKDPRFKDLDLSMQKELLSKLFEAEKSISFLRSLVILLNIFVYIFLFDKDNSIEWLAWTVVVVASLYALLTVFLHPYRRNPILLSAYFTSGSDAILITVWLYATGGFESPFYVLWYVSLLAVAMRFTYAVTMRTAMLYSILYLIILVLDVQLTDHLAELAIRFGYIFLVAAMGGLLSKEAIDQIEAKILLQKSRQEIITREKQLQEARDKLEERVEERTLELNEINHQLMQINEDIDNFVYSASHDLKAPVLNMEALMEILNSENPPEGDFEKDIREKMFLSIQKMKKTISHLADVAKSQKEIYDDIEKISLEDIVKEEAEEMNELVRRENSMIELDFSEIPLVKCSRTCLKSIFYNFISNSIKYRSPEKDPHIKIKSRRERDFLVLYFVDNGLGMDLDRNRHKLFAIFKRMHDHVEGAGIGLYTVKRMVEKYQVDIEVESRPGEGTTFKVRMKDVFCH